MEQFAFVCTPEEAKDWSAIKRIIEKQTGKTFEYMRWKKRSIDARSRQIKINATLECSDSPLPDRIRSFTFNKVHHSPEVHIVGAGPAGLFAALKALMHGLKPVVFERGKDVKARRRDLARIAREQTINEESNYCFGEGGAGTYSDGKLYTRSKKRGEVDLVLELLVYFGADEDILVEAHPHIGTNKLPKIIENIRNFIIEQGGEIHFESKLTGITKTENKISHLEINQGEQIPVKHVILATGHSARDIFYLLHEAGIKISAKPFALGVRVEHTQALIDQMQYHGRLNDEYLAPASYSLVEQIDGRGVYSFCMCPGGIVAPCATATDEIVVNGWSPSKRNNPFANSGLVVQVNLEDIPGISQSPLAALHFQNKVEQLAFRLAGNTIKAPAQRVADFINRKVSTDLPTNSYIPGLTTLSLDEVLPSFISDSIRKALPIFGKKMKGYDSNEALLIGVESRTSSPVRIPRDKITLQHPEVSGFFPCAEGAGYAGGIVSAAIDGQNCVDAILIQKESSQ